MASPEPHPHPLDAALRAQAERRRTELGPAPVELPGPMRSALQREVTRALTETSGSGAAISWWSRLFRWQAALGTVALATLMVGLLVWNNTWLREPPLEAPAMSSIPKPAESPKSKTVLPPAPAAPEKRAVADEVAPAPPATVPAEEKPATVAEDRGRRDEGVSAPPPAPVDADASSIHEKAKDLAVAPGGAAARPRRGADAAPAPATKAAPPVGSVTLRTAPAQPVQPVAPAFKLEAPAAAAGPPASAPAPAPVLAGGIAPGNQQTARYRNQGVANSPRQEATTDALAKEQVLPAAVLQQYDVLLEGNRVTVVDADGSRYTGEILAVAGTDKERTSRDSRNVNALVNRAQKSQGLMSNGLEPVTFRAVGLNKTLQQTVTIEATLSSVPVADGSANSRSQTATFANRRASQSQAQSGAIVLDQHGNAKPDSQAGETPEDAQIIGRATVNGVTFSLDSPLVDVSGSVP